MAKRYSDCFRSASTCLGDFTFLFCSNSIRSFRAFSRYSHRRTYQSRANLSDLLYSWQTYFLCASVPSMGKLSVIFGMPILNHYWYAHLTFPHRNGFFECQFFFISVFLFFFLLGHCWRSFVLSWYKKQVGNIKSDTNVEKNISKKKVLYKRVTVLLVCTLCVSGFARVRGGTTLYTTSNSINPLKNSHYSQSR